MSRSALKKQSSYSQFRKKNSLSKNNLHKSMLQIDNQISLIADDKTSQLLSMQNELNCLVRNRSLSAKPASKSISEQAINFNFEKNIQNSSTQLFIPKRNSIHAMATIQNYQKTSRSIHFQPLNQTFEIIQQSQIHNQEDNGMYDTKQQTNKITSKAQYKNEKNIIPKRKNSNHIMQSTKIQTKATIKDLDQMQKRLQSAKKNKRIEMKQKKVKKPQIITKPIVQKTQRKLYRTNSQSALISQNSKLKGLEILKQKDLTPKPIFKKKFALGQGVKPLVHAQKDLGYQLIPTKMVNNEQKQKLLKQFDKIKQTIKNSQICADNLESIRNMLKNIQGLIN